jgi:hypothetical protein
MSLSDDALRKVLISLVTADSRAMAGSNTSLLNPQLLTECSAKLNAHNRDKQGLQVLQATKERERKLNEFTIRELGSLGADVPTYKAVGKM